MKQKGTLTISNPTGNVSFTIAGEPVQTGETWVINENVPSGETLIKNIVFVSNSQTFNTFDMSEDSEGDMYIYYDNTMAYNHDRQMWTTQAYRTVTFETAPTGDLLTWLQANAVKQ